MDYTQKEVLDALKESGRTGWRPRLMTSLREEGFLPLLKRRPQPGSNAARYAWDDDDLAQIADAYDWWEYYGGNREAMARALWLDGYDISLNLLRDPYLKAVDILQQKLTHGQTDLDDILDEISQSLVKWNQRFRYSPKLVAERKKLDAGQMQRFLEPMMVALAIPEQMESTAEIIQSFLSGTEDDDDAEEAEADEEFLHKSHMVAAILRDILTVQNLREALETAIPDQWEQARDDFYEACELFSGFIHRTTRPELLEPLEEFAPAFKVVTAMWLIPPLLSARSRGHGHWIDKAFDWIRKALASPELEEIIQQQRQQQQENLTIEADGAESEPIRS